jgi:group I intron endonuclease
MWIYEILNTTNQKRYIGQTSRSPSVRWREHKRELQKGIHFNERLQNSWNKYGEVAFEFNVIQQCSSVEELNAIESELISKFGAEYNLTSGGEHYRCIRPRKKWSDQRRVERSHAMKTRKYPISLKSPTGEIIDMHILKEFCRDNELDSGAMSRLISGKVKSHKGWTLAETVQMDWKDRLSNSRRTFIYPRLISEDGRIVEISNLSAFARDNNLNLASVHGVLTGKRKTTKGWKVYE